MRTGAPYIEFDIQCTADRQLVLFTMQICIEPQVSGGRFFFFDYRFAQLHNISAGETERFYDRFSGTRIPLLSQLVELPNAIPITICSRRSSLNALPISALGRLSAAFLELEPICSRCTIISFHLPALQYIRERKPGHMCAVGCWMDTANASNSRRNISSLNC